MEIASSKPSITLSSKSALHPYEYLISISGRSFFIPSTTVTVSLTLPDPGQEPISSPVLPKGPITASFLIDLDNGRIDSFF